MMIVVTHVAVILGGLLAGTLAGRIIVNLLKQARHKASPVPARR